MLSWLIDVLKDVPSEKWSEIVLSYDAMCKIDAMNVVKRPLPLPAPYDTMWSSITKVMIILLVWHHMM